MILDVKDSDYIIWDKKDLPCIKCDLNSILCNIDDVLAVSFDTFLLSCNGDVIIELSMNNSTIGKKIN